MFSVHNVLLSDVASFISRGASPRPGRTAKPRRAGRQVAEVEEEEAAEEQAEVQSAEGQAEERAEGQA